MSTRDAKTDDTMKLFHYLDDDDDEISICILEKRYFASTRKKSSQTKMVILAQLE
jgi:hypothetical protein